MTHAQYIAWAEQQDAVGITDPMGYPWTSWKLAVYRPDGSAQRDALGHQIFETQAEYKARTRAIPVGHTMDLFA